jgi:hypothetical protein
MSPPQQEALERRIALLEAQSDVRRLTARYFRLCDELGPLTQRDEIRAIFTPDAVWEGQGRYRQAFGRHEGADAIADMLIGYAHPPHFALNGHYLASEAIEILSDGRAVGRWMMLQVSTYRDGRCDFRSAALTLDFEQLEDGWRIARFVTRHIFSRDIAPWNDTSEISVPQPFAKEGA